MESIHAMMVLRSWNTERIWGLVWSAAGCFVLWGLFTWIGNFVSSHYEEAMSEHDAVTMLLAFVGIYVFIFMIVRMRKFVCQLFNSDATVSDRGLKFLAACAEVPENAKQRLASILVRNGVVTFDDLKAIDDKIKEEYWNDLEKRTRERNLKGDGAQALQAFLKNNWSALMAVSIRSGL